MHISLSLSYFHAQKSPNKGQSVTCWVVAPVISLGGPIRHSYRSDSLICHSAADEPLLSNKKCDVTAQSSSKWVLPNDKLFLLAKCTKWFSFHQELALHTYTLIIFPLYCTDLLYIHINTGWPIDRFCLLIGTHSQLLELSAIANFHADILSRLCPLLERLWRSTVTIHYESKSSL